MSAPAPSAVVVLSSFPIAGWCAGEPPRGDSPRDPDLRDEDASPASVAPWVLIVEDDRDCRDSLEILLRTSGCEVRSAVNGRQALEILRSGPLPAVILLDNLMPMMTGEEFLEERKADPRLADVPVLMLSAWGMSRRGAPLEVQEYVAKPYDPERVVSLVRDFLKR